MTAADESSTNLGVMVLASLASSAVDSPSLEPAILTPPASSTAVGSSWSTFSTRAATASEASLCPNDDAHHTTALAPLNSASNAPPS